MTNLDLSKYPVLTARVKKHEEYYLLRKRTPPIRKLQQNLSLNCQAITLVKTVVSALSDVGPVRVSFADTADVGRAAAGFDDLVKFKSPFILISNSDFSQYVDDPRLADSICGLAAHEAAHVNWSRETFKAIAKKKKNDTTMRHWIGIWEDDRVECVVADKFPYAIMYLEAARALYISRPIRQQLIVDWERLGEIEKFQTLLFAWVRSPLSLVQLSHDWTDAFGKNPLDEFEKLFPRSPKTESDVVLYAKRTKRLIENFRAKHPSNSSELDDFYQKNDLFSFDHVRIARQLFDDLFNALSENYHSRSKKKQFFPKAEIKRLREIASKINPCYRLHHELEDAADRLEIISEKAKTMSGDFRGSISRLERLARKLRSDQYIPKPKKNVIESFLKSSHSLISKGFSDAEIKSAEEEQKIHFSPRSFDFNGTRVAMIPVVGNAKNAVLYNDSMLHQTDQITALKSHLCGLTRVSQPEILRQRRRGAIDGRQLARAGFSDRIFRTVVEAEKIDTQELLLLLDRSGSIKSAAKQVFDAAILVSEAFRGIHGWRVVIFSHSTLDCTSSEPVVYSYDDSRTDIRNLLPEYMSGEQFNANFDNLAIRAVAANRESQSGKMLKRLLVVISDGLPCGHDAVAETREAVNSLRRANWRVVHVAIGTEGAFESIYGAGYTVMCDKDGLADNLGRVIFRELQGF